MVFFSIYRFEILHVTLWGILHLLRKISWVYLTAARLCEHSSLVMFENRSAKTLQHWHRYGDIIMLCDIKTTYEWYFWYNWHELCSSNKLFDFSRLYYFWAKCAIWISNMNELLPHPLLCWYATSGVTADSGAGTSSFWVMPSNEAIWNFLLFRGRE